MRQIEFLLPWIRLQWFPLTFSLFLATVGVGLDHLAPWILKVILDNPEAKSNWIWIYSAILAIIVSGILGYTQRNLMAKFGRRVESEIRTELFNQILFQPSEFFQRKNPGHLLQNLVQDLEKIQELTGPAFLHFFRTALTLVITTFLLFMISPPLALWGFLFFCVLAYASLFLMAKVYQGHRKIRESQGIMGGYVRDYLSGFSTAKASGSQAYFLRKQVDISDGIRKNTNQVSILTSLIWPTITLLCGLGIAGAVALGYHLFQEGQLTPGSLAAATIYLVRAQYPLVGLGIMAAMVQRGRASLDRILELRRSFVESVPNLEVISPQESFEHLKIFGLHFQYNDSKIQAIEGVDLDLIPGKSIGIVGDTGSGKSTLAKLLSGQLPLPQGCIYLNGSDLSIQQKASLHGSWRSLFSFAPQEGFLFSWTIQENIELGIGEFGRNNVPTVVSQAGLNSDLEKMPEGLQTKLGERGVNLSGGQKQRVGLARALIRSAPITILDDVFSALDPATEELVLQSIRTSNPERSYVIVSHRYTSVMHCDEILFMQNGKVMERGAHEYLLSLKGLYAKNWGRQAAGVNP